MKPEVFTFSYQKQKIVVYALSTGWVKVKTRFQTARWKSALKTLDFIFDRRFTEWMPIWVWVIKHPSGIFVIDTGENARVNDKDYFKPAGRINNWINTTQFKFKIIREEEIDHQLQHLGINPNDVNSVILSHLHLDHVDGLQHFPKTETIVHQQEWENPFGDLPHLYPEHFTPKLVQLEEMFYEFPALSLEPSSSILLLHTPGHTFGHCSVVLKVDQGLLFFAADVCYVQDQLIKNRFSGADADPNLSLETFQKIKNLAHKEKVIFLPSHDPDATRRLKNLDYLI